jgi:phage shock protein A
MKYTIKTITTVIDNKTITLDENHIYHYTAQDGTKYSSDTSVSRLFTKDSSFMNSAKMLAAAKSGTEMHKNLEEFILCADLNKINNLEGIKEKIKDASPVNKEFMMKLILAIQQDYGSDLMITLHPEVKILASCVDTKGRKLYVGGAIDVLVQIFNGTELQYLIIDLKTGKPMPTHEKQVATYQYLMQKAGLKNIRSVCFYTGNADRNYCFIAEQTLEKALDDAFLAHYFEEKKKIEITDESFCNELTRVNEEYERTKKRLEELEKRRKELTSRCTEMYKDEKNITFKIGDLNYTITSFQRKVIDEELVSQKCPEAIKYKEQTRAILTSGGNNV